MAIFALGDRRPTSAVQCKAVWTVFDGISLAKIRKELGTSLTPAFPQFGMVWSQLGVSLLLSLFFISTISPQTLFRTARSRWESNAASTWSASPPAWPGSESSDLPSGFVISIFKTFVVIDRHHRQFHQYYLNRHRDNVVIKVRLVIGNCCDQPIWQW